MKPANETLKLTKEERLRNISQRRRSSKKRLVRNSVDNHQDKYRHIVKY